MTFKKLILSTALMTATMGYAVANAQTIVTETVTETKPLPEVVQIDFSQFDLNNDGIYSRDEVGEVLFNMFDTDGNGTVDNIEWTNNNVMTIIPIKETEFKTYDTNSDGQAELVTVTYDEFYVNSGLMAFDKDKTGLSAKKFIDEGYEVLDTDENKLISLEEWQRVYKESQPKHNQPDNYKN
jgi:hypothetical protein